MKVPADEPKVKLEYYSQQFAKKLFRAFPAWKQYAGHYVKEEDGLSVYYLEVRVPFPNPSVATPLYINSYKKALLIGWMHGGHTHFEDWYKGERLKNEPDYMERAIVFLKRIVADEVVFGQYFQSGKPIHKSFSCPPNDEWLLEMLDPKHGHVVLRSWSGKHDREVNAEVGSDGVETPF